MVIDLRELIFESIDGYMAGVNICLPGRVTAWDGHKASVKPLVKRRYADGTARSLPIINGVPVIMPQTAAGGVILDVQPRDLVLLLFADRSLDKWVASDGREVDPEDPRRFDLSDAVAIPGLWPFSKGFPYGAMKVKICPGGKIAIGKDANHELLDLMSKLISSIDGATANGYPLLVTPPDLEFSIIKQRLDAIKGSL